MFGITTCAIGPINFWEISPEEAARYRIERERVERQNQLETNIITACRENRLDFVPMYLRELDDDRFNALARVTLGGNEETLTSMRQMLTDEENRRFPNTL